MAAAAPTASALALAAPAQHAVPTGHRVLGGAVIASAAVHLAVLAAFQHSVTWTVILLAMTAWCLKCAWCVLRGGSPLGLLGMCAAMGAAHIAMVLGMPWVAGHHAGHQEQAGLHALPMLLMALMEFALMFASALAARRQEAPLSA